MTNSEKVRAAIKYSGKTFSFVANRMGWSRQRLDQKFKRDSWDIKELEDVAKIIGAKYKYRYSSNFKFSDGKKI